jgi:hypothetical protein
MKNENELSRLQIELLVAGYNIKQSDEGDRLDLIQFDPDVTDFGMWGTAMPALFQQLLLSISIETVKFENISIDYASLINELWIITVLAVNDLAIAANIQEDGTSERVIKPFKKSEEDKSPPIPANYNEAQTSLFNFTNYLFKKASRK